MVEFDFFTDIDAWSLNELRAAIDGMQPGDDLVLNIASYGGEIFMALAMIDLIRSKGLRTTCNVFGLAASSAAILALSCDTVNMTPNSSMLLHSAWQDSGEVDEGIKRCNTKQLEIIQKRCPQLGEELFTCDHWYSADECERLGLCDAITVNSYNAIACRYCAALQAKESTMEDVKQNETIEQEKEQPQQEKPEAEEAMPEEQPKQDASVVDVLEQLSQRNAALEQRVEALEQRIAEMQQPAVVAPAAECGSSDEKERLNAIIQTLTKPQAALAVGATPATRPAAVYKPNKEMLKAFCD